MKLQNFENLVGNLTTYEDEPFIKAVCPHESGNDISFRKTDQDYMFGGCAECKEVLEKEPIQIADADAYWFDRFEKMVEESGEIFNDGPNKGSQVFKFKMDFREACGRNPEPEEIGAYKVGKNKQNPQVSRDFTCRVKIYDRPEELDFIKSITDHEVKINKKNTISFSDTALVWALVRRDMKFFSRTNNG